MTKVAIKNREYHFFRWNLHHFFVAFYTRGNAAARTFGRTRRRRPYGFV